MVGNLNILGDSRVVAMRGARQDNQAGKEIGRSEAGGRR